MNPRANTEITPVKINHTQVIFFDTLKYIKYPMAGTTRIPSKWTPTANPNMKKIIKIQRFGLALWFSTKFISSSHFNAAQKMTAVKSDAMA